MTRFACVFLPYWPAERCLKTRNGAAPETRPFALAAASAGGLRLMGVNARAEALGLLPGELLADARARVPFLESRTAEPEKDRAALAALARWGARFSPHAAPWPEANEETGESGDGLILDIAGCEHLFGGETKMTHAMTAAFRRLGLTVRIAIADTIGASHALARFAPEAANIVAKGRQRAALEPLPVEGLRLPSNMAAALKHLGLRRIGDVVALPRAPLAARFGPLLLRRIDQALGRTREPFSPLMPCAPYRADANLAEPITAREHVLLLARRLAGDLMPALERDGKGARVLRLTLFRVDGEIRKIEIRLARPSRDAGHIVQLAALRLDALTEDCDAGFGFEAARLEAVAADPEMPDQRGVIPDPVRAREERLPLLVDRLGSRLGIENVVRLSPRDTHIPERAVVLRPAAHHPRRGWDEEPEPPMRPFLMLPCAEPAEVTALLPEGPPAGFRWRGVHYLVAHAEGPERIRPEWWRKAEGARARDYYVVEDEEGRRFWLYRDGPYGAEAPPRWYMLGVFA